ncbi:MAG TPA: TetR/AcrR family transcriptional regulator [Acetobacteraceae bacterium]|jgi:AcrR family transcriptional regulator|nr:TetR/AcrR family transcriptional regulator [Acetobacteraceae bacterium]
MRDEILAYKRERILEEAVKLFYERGFTGTTLDDIAAELGVTKPFIYTHFRGKVELLAALCKPTIELALGAIANAAARPGTPSERLRIAITDFTKVVLQRQPNIAIYFREEKNLSPEALAEINVLRREFDHLLSDLLLEGSAKGEFEIDDHSLAALALGGMISWAYTWYRPGGRLTLEETAAHMADLALRMAGVRVAIPA